METITQTFIMAILIAIGFLCYKIRIIGKDSLKCLSDLALKVATPALLIVAFQSDLDEQRLYGLGYSFLLAAVAIAVAILAGYLLVRCKGDKGKQQIERFSTIYSNCAFLGIPLVNGIYGEDGVFYLTAFYALFNILVWSHGAIMMKGEKGGRQFLNALKSPALIAVFVGLALFLCRITLPDFICSALTYAGNLTTPLGMMIAGATIAQTSLKKAVAKSKIYYITLLRLLIVPIITIFVFLLFPSDEVIMGTNIAAAACPTAAICTMFAVSYGKDSLYASEIFAVSTILSMLTLPLIMLLFNTIHGF